MGACLSSFHLEEFGQFVDPQIYVWIMDEKVDQQQDSFFSHHDVD